MNTSTSFAASSSAGREIDIDWLRIGALGLLILYHVGMYYVSWDWHVKSVHSAAAAPWLEPLMRLTSPWRMSLLFFVSGLALSLMLARRGPATPGWLRQRARRLLLPLLAGVVLIVPPQAYFEVRQFHGYAGSYLEFLALYFRGHGGFCTAERGCLILPTWNHLWFLPYLFVYSAAAAWVLKRWPHALEAAAGRLMRWFSGWRLFVWPLAWLLLTRLTLQPRFGQTHALVDDVFAHSQYAAFFALGLVAARAPQWPQRLAELRHLALALTLLSWALLLATTPGAPWRALPYSVMQLCGIGAAVGFARVHLRRDGAVRRYLSDAVFPVYVLHQTLTIVAAMALASWALPPAVEGGLLVVITFAGAFAGYEVVRRFGMLRPWFGLAPQRPAAVPAAGRAPQATGGLATAPCAERPLPVKGSMEMR